MPVPVVQGSGVGQVARVDDSDSGLSGYRCVGERTGAGLKRVQKVKGRGEVGDRGVTMWCWAQNSRNTSLRAGLLGHGRGVPSVATLRALRMGIVEMHEGGM